MDFHLIFATIDEGSNPTIEATRALHGWLWS
jgi:hypothetical protein